MKLTETMQYMLLETARVRLAVPMDGNQARTFHALHRLDLVEPVVNDGYRITDKGDALADELLNGGES